MKVSHQDIFKAAKGLQLDVHAYLGPPEEGIRASQQAVLPASITRGTRGYIERIVNQANGTYEWGWYDSTAVMVRRLLETLITEVFEHHKIADRIKNSKGDFLFLGDLIDLCVNEKSWNLSRDTRAGMPRLKEIGDKSAHSRRFNAQKGDLAPLLTDIRVVCQELVYLSGLK